MPIPVQCSQCRKQMRAPDNLAGRNVKCPGCQSVIAVPVPTASEPDALDFYATAPEAGRELEPGWRSVQTGLKFICWSMLAHFCAFFPLQCVLPALLQSTPHGPTPPVQWGSLAVAGLGCVWYVLGLAMCISVPPSTGLKGKATAALASCLLGPLSLIPFLLFLRDIGKELQNRKLTTWTTALMWTVVGLLISSGIELADDVMAYLDNRDLMKNWSILRWVTIIGWMSAMLGIYDRAYAARKILQRFRIRK